MKKAADKYINNKKKKKKMQEGGSMQVGSNPPTSQNPQVPVKNEDMYEVTLQDDSGLVKYGFSKSIVI